MVSDRERRECEQDLRMAAEEFVAEVVFYSWAIPVGIAWLTYCVVYKAIHGDTP